MPLLLEKHQRYAAALLDCVFYDVDYRQCRIIRTDENVLALLRLLREERSQNRNMY